MEDDQSKYFNFDEWPLDAISPCRKHVFFTVGVLEGCKVCTEYAEQVMGKDWVKRFIEYFKGSSEKR